MNMLESLRTAVGSLRVNKLRSLLTMLGIIIGVAAVISLTGLGNGLSNLIDSEISANGSNLLYVSSATESGFASLTLADLNSLAGEPAVAEVAGIATLNAPVQSESDRTFTAVGGVTSNYLTLTNSIALASGTLLTTPDRQEALLGASVAAYLFPEGDAVGQTVTIAEADFVVVGVLAAEAEDTGAEDGLFTPPEGRDGASPAMFVPAADDLVYVPLETAMDLLDLQVTEDGTPALSTLVVAALDETQVEGAIDEVTVALRDQHELAPTAEADFNIRSSAALAATFSTITTALTLFLGAVAGISLLVGGIGIMNIMLVSVTERTREIGIRKALGALRRDILGQFLLEALILSLIGGALGLALGWGISLAGGTFIGIVAAIDVNTILLAVGFSTGVGLLFGIYPAWQAARLRPIDALRYE